MRCLKVFGERINSRGPDRQTAEIHIRIALVNRFSALGTITSVRVDQGPCQKGKSRLRPEFSNTAHQDIEQILFQHLKHDRQKGVVMLKYRQRKPQGTQT